MNPPKDLASGLHAPTATPAVPRARFVGAVSGKGGVGKTNLVANVAVAAAGLGARVLLVDGDLGLANVDVLLGLVSSRNVSDVLEGSCTLDEALLAGPRGVKILPASSGRRDLSALDPLSMAHLQSLLRGAAARYDLVLVDAGAGVGPSVVGLAALCDPVLVVTTPEPTALADAYAAIKVIREASPGCRLELLVNAVRDETEARQTHSRLERVSRRFLGAPVAFRGFLPRDARLVDAVARQRAVVEFYPSAACSRRIVALAADLLRDPWPPSRE